MAAALAKVLRGGRSGASSKLLLLAIGRLMPQEGVAPLLPHLGSPPATSAAGMGRLMHTGLWHNSALSRGTGSKLAGTRGVVPQKHEHMMRMDQFSFSRKRFMSDRPFGPEPPNMAWAALTVVCVTSVVFTLPSTIHTFSNFINRQFSKDE